MTGLVAGGYRGNRVDRHSSGALWPRSEQGAAEGAWPRLWHLLDLLDALPGDFRVRLSSLEAAEVRDDLVRAMAGSRRRCRTCTCACKAGPTASSRLMKRRYTAAGFLKRCRRLKAALDLPAFTTDVIVGFPGETDADFEATCRFVASRLREDPCLFVQPAGRHAGGAVAKRRSACNHQGTLRTLRDLEQSDGSNVSAQPAGPTARRAGGRSRSDSFRTRSGHVMPICPVSFRGQAPALLRSASRCER